MSKNRIKNYMKTVVCTSMILLLAGCIGNFEEYNTNPCAPTPDDMLGDNAATGSLIKNMLPALIQGQQNNSQELDQMIGSEYGGHITNIGMWHNEGNYYTYNPRIGWYGKMFDITMPQIYTSFFQIRDKTEGKGLAYAWAQIIRVAASLKISDCYGPIPYSQITGTAYTVEYDKMDDLYQFMFKDLDAAISTLKTALLAGEDLSSLAEYDMVYAGDFTKWVKFANTLKLRMAMRLTNANVEIAKEKAREAVYDLIGVMTEAGDAAYSSYNDGLNPYFRVADSWNEIRVSANVTSYLRGYDDPRLSIYMKEAETSGKGYVGVRNGIFQSAATMAKYATFSKPNISAGDKLLIMSASEAYFLRAEAALNNWDVKGDAQELYNKGIMVAMEERKATIGNYLENERKPVEYIDPTDAGKNNSVW